MLLEVIVACMDESQLGLYSLHLQRLLVQLMLQFLNDFVEFLLAGVVCLLSDVVLHGALLLELVSLGLEGVRLE